jgi:hypothetical protein
MCARMGTFVKRSQCLQAHGNRLSRVRVLVHVALRTRWNRADESQMVAVEPHAEFSRIGQELTAGMVGLTWQAHDLTSPTGVAQHKASPNDKKKQKKSPQKAGGVAYGELTLGGPVGDLGEAKVEEVEDGEGGGGGAGGARWGGGEEEEAAVVGGREEEQGWDLVLSCFVFAEKDMQRRSTADGIEQEVPGLCALWRRMEAYA